MLTANQLQILTVFIENSGKDFYLSEIGRILDKSPGVFQKGINSLVREKWLIDSRRGNQRVFKINREHPLFNEIKALARKAGGVPAVLKKITVGIKDVQLALIYGSYAKDRLRADSDIDLLVVSDKAADEDVLITELDRAEKSLRREVNYKFYTKRDFFRRRKNNDPFLTEIFSDKYILLKGKL